MAEICCKKCDSNNCEGCNLMTLSDMLNKGQLDMFMNENHTISADKIDNVHKDGFSILGATLLSAYEAEKLPTHLRKYGHWYWLRSQGYGQGNAAIVSRDGAILYIGYSVDYDDNCIRPALKIENLNSSNLQIGDHFKFGGVEFEVVSNDIAFCVGDIGRCAFREHWRVEDEDANIYEKSDIKKFVDSWFNKSVSVSKDKSNLV